LSLSVYDREEHDRTLAELSRKASDPIKERFRFCVGDAKALQFLKAVLFVGWDSHLLLVRARVWAVV
jgi:hypothetical protein